ncbi:MAG: DUF882 domain-containing protein [Pseudolabrys sp.]
MPVRIARERSIVVGLGRAGQVMGLAAALLLIANNSLQTAAAEGDTRTISFHHVHTGEDITVTFKRNGRYEEAALAKLNWFMRDWRKDAQTTMDRHLFDLLWEAYREVGGKEPIQVICGYRSPETNSMLRARSNGVAQFSLHTQGDAMDFYIPGVSLEAVREVGLKMQRGGVGFYPTSGSPFVHLDTGSVRHWPRMTHDQLVKVFPDGRTVHVPSDGRPLAGYALALADVESRGGEPNSVSLAAARNSGVIGDEDRTASLPPKRSFLASLFGARGKTEAPNAPARDTIAVAENTPPAAAPVKVATERIVPLPKGRPVAVAALTPTPAPRPVALASLGRSVIANRGLWPLVETGASSPALPKPVEVASADPAMTGAVSALAYAANRAPAARQVSPMGATAPRAPKLPRAAAVEPDHGVIAEPELAQKSGRLALANSEQTGGRLPGPWLRAMILTPSVSGAMTTTRLGALDPKPLREFMRKPTSALVMSFAQTPREAQGVQGVYDGLTADRFSGSAVVFLATATFGTQRTASLAQ